MVVCGRGANEFRGFDPTLKCGTGHKNSSFSLSTKRWIKRIKGERNRQQELLQIKCLPATQLCVSRGLWPIECHRSLLSITKRLKVGTEQKEDVTCAPAIWSVDAYWSTLAGRFATKPGIGLCGMWARGHPNLHGHNGKLPRRGRKPSAPWCNPSLPGQRHLRRKRKEKKWSNVHVICFRIRKKNPDWPWEKKQTRVHFEELNLNRYF